MFGYCCNSSTHSHADNNNNNYNNNHLQPLTRTHTHPHPAHHNTTTASNSPPSGSGSGSSSIPLSGTRPTKPVDVFVREKVRVESADPSLLSLSAKLTALGHTLLLARRNLAAVMGEEVEVETAGD